MIRILGILEWENIANEILLSRSSAKSITWHLLCRCLGQSQQIKQLNETIPTRGEWNETSTKRQKTHKPKCGWLLSVFNQARENWRVVVAPVTKSIVNSRLWKPSLSKPCPLSSSYHLPGDSSSSAESTDEEEVQRKRTPIAKDATTSNKNHTRTEKEVRFGLVSFDDLIDYWKLFKRYNCRCSDLKCTWHENLHFVFRWLGMCNKRIEARNFPLKTYSALANNWAWTHIFLTKKEYFWRFWILHHTYVTATKKRDKNLHSSSVLSGAAISQQRGVLWAFLESLPRKRETSYRKRRSNSSTWYKDRYSQFLLLLFLLFEILLKGKGSEELWQTLIAVFVLILIRRTTEVHRNRRYIWRLNGWRGLWKRFTYS